MLEGSEMTGRSILITGGNTGLGAHTAQTLAQRGWTVVIACRNTPSGQQTAQHIHALTGAEVHVLKLDLSDLHDISRHATELKTRLDSAQLPPLHAIIANAGLQHDSAQERTAQGFESTFGVNHLGHVHLIQQLFPALQEPGQIILVSSGTHNPAQQDFMAFPAPYDQSARALAFPDQFPLPARNDADAGKRRYSTSKLANVQTALHLARKFQQEGRQITVQAFDPGMMPGTNLARQYPPFLRWGWHHLMPVFTRTHAATVSTPPRSGAHLAALLEPPFSTQTGLYFRQGGRHHQPFSEPPSALAQDAAKAAHLWQDSLNLIAEALQTGPHRS